MEVFNCLNCGNKLIKHKQKKFCSRPCVQNYYKDDKERSNKISKSLKRYFNSLTPEERSILYNTSHKGALSTNTKPIGSFYIMKHGGYKMVKVFNNKWVSEHILVVEKYLGRKLKKGEVVHHINEDRVDNSPENLYLFSKRGLHTSFTQLVKHKIIKLDMLKSNLKSIKIKEMEMCND